MIHVSSKHKVVGVPFRQDLANLFPSSKRLTIEGKEHIVLPHGLEETRVLRNMGLDVPHLLVASGLARVRANAATLALWTLVAGSSHACS